MFKKNKVKSKNKKVVKVKKYKDYYGWAWNFIIPTVIILILVSITQIDFKKKKSSEKEVVISTENVSPAVTTNPIIPEKENSFSKNETKSFQLKNFGDDYYPVPVSTKDTITLNFDGPSGKWSYKIWLHNGRVGYEEIIGQSRPVAGSHTLTVDKPCKILWTSKVPLLL